jgi:hypothetical protein
MTLNKNGPNRKRVPEDPIENQPPDWATEDREIEDRKPYLGERRP